MNIYENYVTLLNVNDGAPGEPGAPGKDLQKYKIETNQDEILKFYANNGDSLYNLDLTFSPEELKFQIYENDPTNSAGQSLVELTSISDFKFYYYERISQSWQEFFLPEDYKYSGENGSVEYTYYSIDNNVLSLYFNVLKNYGQGERLLGEEEEAYENRMASPTYTFINRAMEQDIYLRILYKIKKEEEIYISEKYINISNAMTQDMAKLSVEANGIFSSIAETKLEFSRDGLKIKNGGIQILNNNLETVLESDINGNLRITGEINAQSGVFHGQVYASGGVFTGTIEAQGGTIGGFDINGQQLTSISKIGESESPAIVLDGTQGKIYAQTIELGTGAFFSEYLNLGNNVKLWNPERNLYGNFLEVYKKDNAETIRVMSFNQEGSMIIGEQFGPQIKIDGPAREIKGWNPGINNIEYSWAITPGQAIFNNISARGSIKAAAFEYGKVQSMGGTMLIRPSSRIVAIAGQKVTLDSIESGFEIGDTCLLERKSGEPLYYKIEDIDYENNAIILNSSPSLTSIGSPIIDLGKQGSIGIGLNGSSTESYKMPPNSISILEFGNSNSLNPKIILGKLPEDKDSFGEAAGSYGLYAENVVLNGSLTTKSITSSNSQNEEANKKYSYSGIGTTIYDGAPNALNIEGVQQKFPRANNIGQILLWAGAEKATKEGIEKAKFFVDEYGNMYAGSGYFDGTIITNSVIEAAEIKTAKLTGIGKDKDGQNNSIPALSIQNVKEGIHFYQFDENNSEQQELVFQLSSNGFNVNGLDTVFNDNFIINKNGELELFRIQLKDYDDQGNKINAMLITGKKIEYKKSSIELSDESSLILNPDGRNDFIINQSGFSMNGSLFYMYGEEVKGEYKQVIEDEQVIGYDLYIY